MFIEISNPLVVFRMDLIGTGNQGCHRVDGDRKLFCVVVHIAGGNVNFLYVFQRNRLIFSPTTCQPLASPPRITASRTFSKERFWVKGMGVLIFSTVALRAKTAELPKSPKEATEIRRARRFIGQYPE